MSNIEKIIKAGMLVDPAIAEKAESLSETQLNFLLGLKKKPFLINDEIIKILKSPKIETPFEAPDYSRRSMQDFVNAYNKRYSKLQKILSNKSELRNLTSVSNITSGEVSIIGLVKSKEWDTIEIEDSTGVIRVFLNESFSERLRKLMLDEVIGVYGYASSGKITANEFFYPDIPLKEMKKTIIPSIVFIGPSGKIPADANFVFSLEELKPADYMSFINIKRFPFRASVCGIDFLMHNKDYAEIKKKIAAENIGRELLIRRHMASSKPELVIEEVPDMFVLLNNENSVENYKGVTIICLDKDSSAKIDLQTREVEIIS